MKSKLKSILLVDDDDATNFINRMIIESSGLNVKINICYDGKEALDFLKGNCNPDKNDPGLIFLDINMPYMNGWEFLNEYEKLDDSCKVMKVLAMLTTSINPDDEEKARGYPQISSFMQKPLSKQQLLNIVDENFCRN